MQSKTLRILQAAAILAAVWFSLAGLNLILESSSDTYQDITEEIDQRDIDTGNATNYFGDETSADAVYEAEQTLQHPPGLKAE